MKKTIRSNSVRLFLMSIFMCNHSLQAVIPSSFLIRMNNSDEKQVVQAEQEAEKIRDYWEPIIANNKEKIRNYHEHLKQRHEPQPGMINIFEEFSVRTPSGIDISVSFFNRSSNTLVVAGQGFQHPKHSVYPIAALYPNYDIVVFNYRWVKLWSFAMKLSTIFSPFKQFLLKEYEEVATVVNHIKQQKKYDMVVGHALCYSTYPFITAQAKAQKQQEDPPFNKIILDSTFSTTEDILEKVVQDPFLFCQAQIDHTPRWWKSILRFLRIPQVVAYLTREFAGCSTLSLLSKIKNTPIMFIHGQTDVLVPVEENFSKIWEATSQTVRFAFLTPFEHVMNMTKNRGLYKKVCELFIQHNPEELPQQFPLKPGQPETIST